MFKTLIKNIKLGKFYLKARNKYKRLKLKAN